MQENNSTQQRHSIGDIDDWVMCVLSLYNEAESKYFVVWHNVTQNTYHGELDGVSHLTDYELAGDAVDSFFREHGYTQICRNEGDFDDVLFAVESDDNEVIAEQ
jgi:hypothetical protein